MFLPETGIPIWKIDRIITELAVWLPEPFTVAIWMLKSLITLWPDEPATGSEGDTSIVDIDTESLHFGVDASALFLFDYMAIRRSVARRDPN